MERDRDLTCKALKALQRCTDLGDELMALDWNHPCYFFDPHQGVDPADDSQWAVPVLPDGDNYLFLDRALRFGIIGNCVLRTINVFGEALLAAFSEGPPVIFERTTWSATERQKMESLWKANSWSRLPYLEYEEWWERFDERFHFFERSRQANIPAIDEPSPSVTFDISKAMQGEGPELGAIKQHFRTTMRLCFQRCLAKDEKMFGLDALRWYEQYSFNPESIVSSERDGWALDVLPDRNWSIFFTADFRLGLFGDPNQRTLCIFGHDLLAAINEIASPYLANIVRKNGAAI
jgi:hypothetical protein